jgi:S-adenosylmethionine:tRNA ribosyltransferase-isomerase
MSPATWPRPDSLRERLLVVDAEDGSVVDEEVRDLVGELDAGDLVVVNDAATLPASLPGRHGDAPIELRLLAAIDDVTWRAVLFGDGDWRTRTEHRDPPPVVAAGDALVFCDDISTDDAVLDAVVVAVDPSSPRLLTVRFDGSVDDVWAGLYRIGRPVQYAHLEGDLALWQTQTAYAARPWAVELPSAGRPLRWPLLQALRDKGVRLATLTHAAGLSATGDDVIDAALPFPERYDIPDATVAAIADVKANGGRVVAVGTTVVRALEGCVADHGALRAGEGVTAFKLSPQTVPVVVDALFTGMHEATSSHYQLLHAFAPAALLEEAYAWARARGFLEHEFGDSCLIWR